MPVTRVFEFALVVVRCIPFPLWSYHVFTVGGVLPIHVWSVPPPCDDRPYRPVLGSHVEEKFAKEPFECFSCTTGPV